LSNPHGALLPSASPSPRPCCHTKGA